MGPSGLRALKHPCGPLCDDAQAGTSVQSVQSVQSVRAKRARRAPYACTVWMDGFGGNLYLGYSLVPCCKRRGRGRQGPSRPRSRGPMRWSLGTDRAKVSSMWPVGEAECGHTTVLLPLLTESRGRDSEGTDCEAARLIHRAKKRAGGSQFHGSAGHFHDNHESCVQPPFSLPACQPTSLYQQLPLSTHQPASLVELLQRPSTPQCQ